MFYLKSGWDCIISFPPCTDLALSGAAWFEKKRADGRQEESIKFFFDVWKHSNATENPMGIFNGGKYIAKWFPSLYRDMVKGGFTFRPSNIIQPYEFGDPVKKTTCLWLNGLPPLLPTQIVTPDITTLKTGARFSTWDYNISMNHKERAKLRSKTFPGIAAAFATQWGDYLINNL
jgi:hypothetical protein